MKLKKISFFLFSMLRLVEKKMISRLVEKIARSVFRKDTFSGVYTSFSSFAALEHKLRLVCTLLRRSFTIVSDFSEFYFEVDTVKKKKKNYKNAYPKHFLTNI